MSTGHMRSACMLTDRDPAQSGVLGIMLQGIIMQMLDNGPGQRIFRNINRTEMVTHSQNIVHRHSVSGLVRFSVDVVGIVGHPNLQLMVYPGLLFFTQNLKNRIRGILPA